MSGSHLISTVRRVNEYDCIKIKIELMSGGRIGGI